jgi:streptogramin lyase
MSFVRVRVAAVYRLSVVLVSLALADPLAARSGVRRPATTSVSVLESIGPGDIAVGSDGNLWFPETGGDRIGRITTSGVVEEFTIPGAAALGRVIAPGPDGKLWVLGFGLDGRLHVWAVDRLGLADEIAVLGDNPPLGPGFLPGRIPSGRTGTSGSRTSVRSCGFLSRVKSRDFL